MSEAELRKAADEFKEAMLQKMLDHVRYKHPEDPLDPWNHFGHDWLVNRLHDEIAEYEDSLKHLPTRRQNKELLDIANFCFFLYMVNLPIAKQEADSRA